jgi:hypothetical protein
MGKRKVFTKTDLSIPQVEYSHDIAGNVVILPEAIPPSKTKVSFRRSACQVRSFDFARWYGAGINPITYACQRQIERFLSDGEAIVETSTVTGYCRRGMRYFLEYCVLRAAAFGRELVLDDVNRDLIDGFLGHLAGLNVKSTTQKTFYAQAKPVLLALGRRGLIHLVTSGDAATFPKNPFPNVDRKTQGETALSKSEQQAFTVALRQAVRPIWDDDASVTGELLCFVLLVVALHTGRNTTPLLEMGRDCLRPHPKDNTVFLVLWKRRGYNTSKAALRVTSDSEGLLESTPTVRTNVERLIRRAMTLTEPLEAKAPDDLRGRVWLYRSRSRNSDKITALNGGSLSSAISLLVARYNLTDIN